MKAFSELQLKWQGTQHADKAMELDARTPTSDWVGLLKALRLQYAQTQEWSQPIKQQALAKLFVDGFSTIGFLKGRFSADRVASCVHRAAAELMTDISEAWGTILRGLSEKINSKIVMIPPEVKDTVLAHEETCKNLLGNPAYEALPPLCDALANCRKIVKSVGHDGTRLPQVVAIDVMKMSSEACKAGYMTVITTFGVFLCMQVLPAQKVLLERRKEIEQQKSEWTKQTKTKTENKNKNKTKIKK